MGSGSSGSSSAAAVAASSIGGAGSPAVSNLSKLQSNIDKQFTVANKALAKANEASARADALIPYSAADLNFRDSFSSSPMNTYNVTVNGALDSESTARQIVDLLNRSEARGTLGAGGLIGAVSF